MAQGLDLENELVFFCLEFIFILRKPLFRVEKVFKSPLMPWVFSQFEFEMKKKGSCRSKVGKKRLD